MGVLTHIFKFGSALKAWGYAIVSQIDPTYLYFPSFLKGGKWMGS